MTEYQHRYGKVLDSLAERCELRDDDRYVYYILPNSKIHIVLGTVKKKNDNRFEWTHCFSRMAPKEWVPTTPNQGVCDTHEAAVEMLYKGWETTKP